MVGTRAAAIAALCALGCGGGDEGTALEGIYELASWTSNPTDCSAEGEPSFEEGFYSHFFVRDDVFFGEFMINAVTCDSLEACRADAAEEDTLFIGAFYFDEGSDEDGWVGARGGLDEEQDCSGTIRIATLTGEPGISVRIEEEARSVSGVPLDDEGECDFDGAVEQAQDRPCEELLVVTGTFVEGI